MPCIDGPTLAHAALALAGGLVPGCERVGFWKTKMPPNNRATNNRIHRLCHYGLRSQMLGGHLGELVRWAPCALTCLCQCLVLLSITAAALAGLLSF